MSVSALSVATQGLAGANAPSVATQGFVWDGALVVYPGGLNQLIRGGLHTVGTAGTQTLLPGSLLAVQRGGLHIVSGGNVASRWFFIRVWQPLWTWIDQAVGGNNES